MTHTREVYLRVADLLELRLLRYFLAVVELGSVTRAAAQVSVAQPSLSRQIRSLEQTLGVALFRRTATGAVLTAAGTRLVPMARDLVARADTAERRMKAISEGIPDSLTVVAPATTVADVIAPFLAQGDAGGVVVTAREDYPAAVYGALDRGDADLAISSGPPPAAFSSRPVVRFALWAYVPATHPWADRVRIRIEELVTEPLIVLGEAHGTRRLLDIAIADSGASYHRAFETNLPEIAQAFAASGHGVAVVTDDPRYDLQPVYIEGALGVLSIQLFAAWEATHYAAEAIAVWVDSLAQYCRSRYGDLPT